MGNVGVKCTEPNWETCRWKVTISESPLWGVRGWKRLTVHEEASLVVARKEFLAWLREVPNEQRADLEARLHSERDHAHLSARLEHRYQVIVRVDSLHIIACRSTRQLLVVFSHDGCKNCRYWLDISETQCCPTDGVHLIALGRVCKLNWGG